MLTVNKKEYPDYFHVSDSTPRRELNMDAIELNRLGMVDLQWEEFNKGEILDKIILIEENLYDIYAILKRTPKIEKYNKIKYYIEEYRTKFPDIMQGFLDLIIEKTKHYQTLPGIIDIDDEKETIDALYGLARLLENGSEISKRSWSIFLYKDSKRWEIIEKKILHVLKKYIFPEFQDWEDKDVLAEFGVINNPQLVTISGPIAIKKNDRLLDFSIDKFGVGIHPITFEKSDIVQIDVNSIVTIENKTSYYDYLNYLENENRKELVIYLGGYHNNDRRIILKKIYDYILEKHLDVTFYHWGDIDYGGFRIWSHLCKKTEIKFVPIFMDKNTFLKYLSDGKDLDGKSYRSKLEALKVKSEFSPFYELIDLMLTHNKKIEQESIILNGDVPDY